MSPLSFRDGPLSSYPLVVESVTGISGGDFLVHCPERLQGENPVTSEKFQGKIEKNTPVMSESAGSFKTKRPPRYTRQVWAPWAMFLCLIRTDEYRRIYDKYRLEKRKLKKAELAERIKQAFNLKQVVNPYNYRENDYLLFSPSAFRIGRKNAQRHGELRLPDFVDLSKRDEDIFADFRKMLRDARKGLTYKPVRNIKLHKIQSYLEVWERVSQGKTTRQIAVERNPSLDEISLSSEFKQPENWRLYLDYLDKLIYRNGLDEKTATVLANRKYPQYKQINNEPQIRKLKAEMKRVREHLKMANLLIEGGEWRSIR